MALVTAVLVLPSLGQRYVGTTDEARFILYAREALAQRALFDVRLRGKFFREKPPLYAWAIAAFSLPRGRVTEGTAQLPVALGAIGASAFTFLLGDRLFTRRAAIWAGLVLATMFGFYRHSQILLPEMIVLAFATAAAYWFWRAMEEPPGRGALSLFYVALALALYAKGPLGLLPFLVAAIWLSSQRGRAALKRLWSPCGLGLFAAITLTWVVPFLVLGTGTYAHTVLWQDWLLAYGSAPGSAVPRGVTDALGFFAPWILLVPLIVTRALPARRSPAVAYALLAWVVPFVIVLMSAHFRTRYLLASTPGFALLVAWWADSHASERTRLGRAIGWSALAAMAAVTLVMAWPGVAPRGIPQFGLAGIPLVGAGWGLALALWVGLTRGRESILVGGMTAATAVLLLYGTWLANTRFGDTGDIPRLAARLEAYARGREAGVLFETGWLEVDYYLGRPLREIGTAPELEAYLARTGGPVLTNESTWNAIRSTLSPRVRVLERVTARGRTFVLLGWSPDGSPGAFVIGWLPGSARSALDHSEWEQSASDRSGLAQWAPDRSGTDRSAPDDSGKRPARQSGSGRGAASST